MQKNILFISGLAVVVFLCSIFSVPHGDFSTQTAAAVSAYASYGEAIESTESLRQLLSDKSVLSSMSSFNSTAVIEQRYASMRTLIATAPDHIESIALSPAEREKISPSLREKIEEQVSVEGYLMRIGNTADGNGAFVLAENSGAMSDVFLPQRTREYAGSILEHAQTPYVRLSGYRLDNSLAALSVEEVPVAPSAYSSYQAPKRTHNVGILLVDFKNYKLWDRDPVSGIQLRPRRADYASFLFSAPRSVKAYYLASTYNKFTFTGKNGAAGSVSDVYGPFPINYTDDGVCRFAEVAEAAKHAAIAKGIPITSYDALVIQHPRGSVDGCEFSGLAQFPWPGAEKPLWVWLDGSKTELYRYSAVGSEAGIYAHEFGHTLGFTHSNGLSCINATGNPVSISNNCSEVEYADPFDVMSGNYSAMYTLNAGIREYLQVFKSEYVSIASTSGTYYIYPLHTTAANPKSLHIPLRLPWTSTSTIPNNYIIEYRKKNGAFDTATTEGVFIRRQLGGELKAFHPTALIDMTPKSSYGFSDAKLKKGAVLTDPFWNPTLVGCAYNFGTTTITALDITPDYAKIKVTMSPPSDEWNDCDGGIPIPLP